MRKFVPVLKSPATAGRRDSLVAARNAAHRSRPTTIGAPEPESYIGGSGESSTTASLAAASRAALASSASASMLPRRGAGS